MNNARLAVGVQGLGIADRALQAARAYAGERVQGVPIGGDPSARLPIRNHPDVRRNLMTMRAWSEAARCIIYYTAGTLDRAKKSADAAERAEYQAQVDLLIPIAKAWSTDRGCTNASIAVQIHGGMGFIEETGVAQFYRDARIAPIYEGTNGIQAMDLLGRKLLRDEGTAAQALIKLVTATVNALGAAQHPALRGLAEPLQLATSALNNATQHLLNLRNAPAEAFARATPYLDLFGLTLGGWLLARSARTAQESGHDIAPAKLAVAQFYMTNLLPAAAAQAATVMGGAASTLALPPEAI